MVCSIQNIIMRVRSLIYYSVIFSVLISCSDDIEQSSSERNVRYTEANNYLDSGIEGIEFNNNLIFIEEQNVQEKSFFIQKISQQKEDIIFRAQRIPNELYLLNAGVSEADLPNALKEIEDEQLFYFEFEEEQKSDLIKKYFSENLDKSISYLAFDIFQDFELITDSGEKISANYSIYERAYHVRPYERIIVSFSNIDEDESVNLIYKDRIFGKGKSEFSFASKQFIDNNSKNPS